MGKHCALTFSKVRIVWAGGVHIKRSFSILFINEIIFYKNQTTILLKKVICTFVEMIQNINAMAGI